ncbi:MAG: VWA domain-containing protein [Acidobacteriota bacterium]|jgi:Ca-activated chloride channel family protein|nr:VWA domain-containing protein [Bryobacteraceae bacterium CoA2 C42]
MGRILNLKTLSRRALLAAPVAAAAQEVVFKTDVNLVRLLVTVKNAAGEMVGGLEPGDFQITDNGAPQTISVFERRTAQPLSVALALDISGSTASSLKYQSDALLRFAKALFADGNPEDAASLITFNWEVVRRSDFTRRLNRLEGALKGFKSEAGTSLYDAILLSADELRRREGRRVLVLITDGGDTTSSTDFHKALEAAHQADAVIYSILIVPITNGAGRNVGGENALTQFSRGTGGRVFLPALGPELDKAFGEILRDLRTQYLIGYYPKAVPLTKNRFHTVKVGLRDPQWTAQTRTGYYGASL